MFPTQRNTILVHPGAYKKTPEGSVALTAVRDPVYLWSPRKPPQAKKKLGVRDDKGGGYRRAERQNQQTTMDGLMLCDL